MTILAADGHGNEDHGAHSRVVDALRAALPRLPAMFEPLPHPAGEDGAEGSTLRLAALDAALSALEIAPLLPGSLLRAVRRRQVAWIGGRLCAEHALERLGEAGRGVPRGTRGEPVWPPGVAGSITHTDLAAHAIVLRRADGAGVGIDSELLVDEQAQTAVATVCCSADERATWLAGPDARVRTTLLFAAKEAFYKAAWPAVRRFVDFGEAAVQAWHESTGTMVLRLASTLTPAEALARYRVDEAAGTVHVLVTLDTALVARLARTTTCRLSGGYA